MKLHFLGFLIGSSALAAAVSFAQPIAEDISVIGGSFSLHDSIGRISTLAIPNFKIDARTAATLIARPIDVIDLIVAQANPTFVSKDGASTNIHVDAEDDPTGEKTRQKINAEIQFRINKPVEDFHQIS